VNPQLPMARKWPVACDYAKEYRHIQVFYAYEKKLTIRHY